MKFWLAWRYFASKGNFLNLSSALSVLGMVLGVSSLVICMAVVSGYEATLRRAVIEVVGHLLVIKRGQSIEGKGEVERAIKPKIEGFKNFTPFVVIEAVLAHNKKVSGVLIEGADPDSVDKVQKLRSRLVDGEFDLGYFDDRPNALIGKGLAEKFNLKVGDVFRVVTPQNNSYDHEKFRARPQSFNVKGILSLGRYDYDQRFILTSIYAAQDFAEIGNRVTGVRIQLMNDEMAMVAEAKINADASNQYWARSWLNANRNLFDAVKYEKPIIFVVILLIVLAASFNITSTLFVSVMKRYADISILKTMGANRGFILQVFALQGLLIGFVGSVLGILVGLACCVVLTALQNKYGIIPGEVYKIQKIDLSYKWSDIGLIMSISMSVCLLASFFPAYRGASLPPVKGVRYE